jgi:hypothetical protein
MKNVLAYLDAGSGSLILQLLAGGFAALAVTAKLWWRRLLNLLRIRRDDDQPAVSSTDSTS